MWRKKERKCLRKAGPGMTTAKLELKPPPYPLISKKPTLGIVWAIMKKDQNALEPHMSRDTLEYHWGKHHGTYVENLNKQIVGTELDGMTLEGIIIATDNKGDLLPAFNNAAQVGFVKEFKATAATQFGSGWAWLTYKANRLDVGNAVNPPPEEDKKLVVVKSPNAMNPLVWDYTISQNRRPDYISTFMEKLVSWEAVNSRLEKAKARAAEREREEEKRKREQEEGNAAGNEVTEMYLDSETDDSEAE
ncbi:unnamed protein product [Camellia sinensis]